MIIISLFLIGTQHDHDHCQW